jgi:hypothetical protein
MQLDPLQRAPHTPGVSAQRACVPSVGRTLTDVDRMTRRSVVGGLAVHVC